MFLALLIILLLKLKKSPFDAPKAHQEIVGGVEVKFSGTFYGIIYMAKMTENIFVYSLVFLFDGVNWWLGMILDFGAFLAVSAVDNATARVRIDHLVRAIYMSAFVLAILAIEGLVYV